MSASHQSGAFRAKKIRNGCPWVLLTFPFAFNTTGIGSAVKVGTIKATAKSPVYVKARMSIDTVFNAVTTNVVTAGTSTTANELINGSDVSEASVGIYPIDAVTSVQAPIMRRYVADTDIYVKYTQSGTAATTGAATLLLEVADGNTKAIV